MRSWLRPRPTVAVVLSGLLFVGLHGVALADQTSDQPNITGGTIAGVVTDSAGNPLAGLTVDALGGSDFPTLTAGDGSYTLSLPPRTYTVTVWQWQNLYAQLCLGPDGFVPYPDPSCTDAVTVTAEGTVTANVSMSLAAGVTIAVTPDGTTTAAGTGQAFVATMTAPQGPPKFQAVPAGKGSGIDLSNVSAIATYGITGDGTCVGSTCTPPYAGDYTVTATYLGVSGSATLHATGAAAPTPGPTATPTQPPAAPDPTAPAPTATPPITSTDPADHPSGGATGLLLAALMSAFAAAVLTSAAHRRRAVREP